MLSKSEKKELRRKAANLSAIFQIGKDGMSDNQIRAIDDALEAHELIKISCLKTCPQPMKEIAFDMSHASNSEIILMIGKTFVLFRKNPKKRIKAI